MSIIDFFKYAELAQASYADLSSGAIDNTAQATLQDQSKMTLTHAAQQSTIGVEHNRGRAQ